METPISMREAAAQLDRMYTELSAMGRQVNKSQPGGFEKELLKLVVHTLYVKQLLDSRIYGQLVDTPVESLATHRLYDKDLSRC